MKKSVAIILVLGVAIVISLLAIAAIQLMGSQAFVGEHKIHRQRANIAAQSAMVYVLEQLRKGEAVNQDKIDGISSSAKITVNIGNLLNETFPGYEGCRQIDISVDY